MKYAKILTNDVVNGENVCVSLFMQGCTRHCKNCFNPDTWDFEGGQEIKLSTLVETLIQAIGVNGIQRNFSILGGEPLNEENVWYTATIIDMIKKAYPNIQIWVWTGYTLEELQDRNDIITNFVLSNINVLVDGPYVDEERDLSLPYRGSRNQRVIHLNNIDNK